MMGRPTLPYADRDTLEARFAGRVTAALGERAAVLPDDVAERLRFAREQALARAREARASLPLAAPGLARLGPVAALFGGPSPWWLRLATVLPLVLLVFGLVVIERHTVHEQMLAAAEIDAVLLADELPPDAWADPGFREFLRSPLSRSVR